MIGQLPCSVRTRLGSSRGHHAPGDRSGRVKRGGSPGLSPRGRLHNRGVTSYLTIGDFSRATHMTVKTLRHYHEIGLLQPADVDPQTGYRRYFAEQIPTAQVV